MSDIADSRDKPELTLFPQEAAHATSRANPHTSVFVLRPHQCHSDFVEQHRLQ